MNTHKYDIILPHFGLNDELTRLCLRCLETIRQHSRDYRLIFVDNGSPQFDAVWPEVIRHPYLLVRYTANVGFVKAVNAGLWLSTAPYVVIVNNDIEALPGWLEKLRKPLLDDVGMAGPLTTTPDSWQGKCPAAEGLTMLLRRTAMLAFFCVMIRRDVIERIGALDEQYGVGLGDDDNFCRRAHAAGFRLALVRDLVIPHAHRSTFRALYTPEQIAALQAAAMERLQKEKPNV